MCRGVIRHTTLLLLLVFVAGSAHAQKRKKEVQIDTVKVAFFHGFTVHADLIGAYQMLFCSQGQWELGARINLKDRYFPAVELGWGHADKENEYSPELKFKTNAPYFRIGCDFNILRNKHDKYKMFIGLRYAFTSFNYDMTVAVPANDETTNASTEETTTTTTTATPVIQYEGLHCNYHWLEGVFGVDVKIWGPLHLGWDVRYRRRLINKYADEGEPWYIPGYGGKKTAGFGANFNLTFGF